MASEDSIPGAPPGLPDAELLRLIFESAAGFAIFTTDPDGIVTSWNVAAERLLGFSDAEIVGQSADVIFPPEEGGTVAAIEERRIAAANGRAEDERWQMRKDGSRFWASGLMTRLADPAAGFLKIVRDRSEHHAAETQLAESEELFRALATNIPQLVFRSAADGSRTWPSPQWSVYSGLGRAESVGFGWLNAIHPDDRAPTLEAWREAPAKGEYYVEHRIRRSVDGEYRWHQTRAVLLAGRQTEEWVGTSTDIHELRNLQDRQKLLVAELQHRTRNLLAVVQSLARRTIRSSASPEEFTEKFEGRLEALSRVQGILARSDHRPVNIQDLVRAELEAHAGGTGTGKVSTDGPPAWLAATAAQSVALALHELATNAVKYGALGQAAGTVSVTWIIEEAPERRVAIEWVETGVPMPAGGQVRKGYGSELIERALPYQLGATTRLEFGAGGVRCEISVPLAGDMPDE